MQGRAAKVVADVDRKTTIRHKKTYHIGFSSAASHMNDAFSEAVASIYRAAAFMQGYKVVHLR